MKFGMVTHVEERVSRGEANYASLPKEQGHSVSNISGPLVNAYTV